MFVPSDMSIVMANSRINLKANLPNFVAFLISKQNIFATNLGMFLIVGLILPYGFYISELSSFNLYLQRHTIIYDSVHGIM
jgi:hypothetical protein